MDSFFCQTPQGWPISGVRNIAEFLTISDHNSPHKAFAPCVSFLLKYNFINSYLLQIEKLLLAFLHSPNNCINNHANPSSFCSVYYDGCPEYNNELALMGTIPC
jgi:hypothetical protein